MGKKVNDFILESKGLCFLCSYREPHPPSVSIHSFQHLSHYLQIDIGKVFSGDGPIPPHLLAKVQNSKLKVELCDDCGSVNNRFSELYQKLEKIRLEVGILLEVIMRKLENVHNKDNKSQQFEEDPMMTELDKFLTKQKGEVVKTMREETKQKCYSKLQSFSAPRVRVQNFTEREITGEIGKLRRETLNNKPLSQTNNIESEPVIMALLKTESEDFAIPSSNYSDEISNTDANSDLDDPSNSFEADSDEQDEICQSSPPQSKEKRVNGESFDYRGKYIIDAKSDKHTCKDCLMKFGSFAAFYHHYNQQHLKISYKCSACKKTFTQMSSLNIHQNNVHKGLKFKCSACNQLFSLESHLFKHRKSGICKPKEIYDKSTSNMIILRSPRSPKEVIKLMENSWDPQSGNHFCRICSKPFETKGCLRAHCRSYHGQIRFKCALCQKIFPLRHHYRRHHTTVHLGLRIYRFKCPKCQKHFTTKKSLSKHSQNPKACQRECAKKVKKEKKQKLPSEIEIDNALVVVRHGNTSKFKCSPCSKIFSSKAGFRKHYKTAHQNFKYTCPACERQFSSNQARNEHHQQVHMKVRLKCLKCSKLFSFRSSLWSHQNKNNTRCNNKQVSSHKMEQLTGTPDENS